MGDVLEFNGPIYRAGTNLGEKVPLYVYLVKGANYAAWIDSGVKAMFPLLQETMARAGLANGDLRFILHTHSHHDHIGCNARLQDQTGCLIAAHPYYAAWHQDFEQHYREFARPFPHLVPDTPELREEVLSPLDEPRPLDLYLDEGVQFNLGGGVSLKAISFPGHLLAELGWFEALTGTLILGDAVTGLEWPLFHSHLSVQAYRDTLVKIGTIVGGAQVKQVLFAHFPPMTTAETTALLAKAAAYIDEVEATILRLVAGQEKISLADLWAETCRRMERLQEFRALNMVYAHVQDLLGRNIIREIDREIYQLRA